MRLIRSEEAGHRRLEISRPANLDEEGTGFQPTSPATGRKRRPPTVDRSGKAHDPIAVETLLKERTHALADRAKELACLFSISNITERQDIPLGKIFQAVLNVLPSSMQYPEIACGRIVFDGKNYVSGEFRESSWRLAAEITFGGDRRGTIEVFYGADRPKCYEGPFLREERYLVNDIALRLGRYIEYRHHEELIRSSEECYRDLVECLSCSVLIVENEKISFANSAMIDLIGATNADEIVGRDFADVVHADSRGQCRDFIGEGDELGDRSPPVEIKLIRLGDRHVVDVEASAIRIARGNSKLFQVILREIIERKQAEAENLYDRLSKRERQIMDLVVRGETSKVIAIHLGIRKKTVENHRANLIRKMESHSLADLIRKATVLGIR